MASIPPATPAASGCGISVMMTSEVRNVRATEAAFSMATRSTYSTHCSLSEQDPKEIQQQHTKLRAATAV